MPTTKWTQDQIKVIESRNTNVLVSAAAGSGKTTVLIERIFSKIDDKNNPVDVDKFVIVTFTRAAAAQMKEKLRSRIEKEIEKRNGDSHLQRQLSLLSHAHISTIHSFCGFIIQNYFHRINLDPSYRQASDSELALIKADVLEELLEREYEKAEDDFVELANMNKFNKRDTDIEAMINLVYEKAMSEPFPLEWLEKMENFFEVANEDEWEKTEIIQYLIEYTRNFAKELGGACDSLLEICDKADGPYFYKDNVLQVKEIANDIYEQETYDKLYAYLNQMKFPRMATSKDTSINADKKEYIKSKRNEYKTELVNLQKRYYYQSASEHLTDLLEMKKNIKTIIRLTREFFYDFTEEKRRRNVVDFNDLEQLSIKILLEKDGDTYKPSQAACELRDFFEEIMIDEYQDSNMVQEAILSSICRKEANFSNMFMVGDVKQSIYGFRNACPQLFIEKMNSFSQEEGFDRQAYEGQRIDLHKNYRSSATILEGCNEVFRKIMRKDIGGIEYDKDAEFVPGLDIKSCPDNSIPDTIESFMIKDGNIKDEAELIASLIKNMVDEEPYYINDEKKYRKVKYGDIVILARSTKSIGQVIFDALSARNIPCIMERSEGFYHTREIQIMTQVLEIIDNPRVDIPLVGVLLSPMFSFTEDELAKLRTNKRGMNFYDSLLAYMEEDELGEKVKGFLLFLEQMRDQARIDGVSNLIESIYNLTGIYDKIALLPDGLQRLANMDSLLEQAKEYEKSSFHGLHSFVSYIRNIKEREQEIGEVNIASEEDDAVRIMTMHKSKGLEFPVCFLAGLGKQLKNPDKNFLKIWQDVGISSKIIYNHNSTRKANIYEDLISGKNKMDDLAEELRILYVSMTRAKEKLFLVGCIKKDEFDLLSGYVERLKMVTYFDMLIPTIIPPSKYFENYILTPEDVEDLKLKADVKEQFRDEKLYNFDTNKIYNSRVESLLNATFVDDYVQVDTTPVKVSVSEIKHKFMEENDSAINIFDEDEEKPLPDFAKNDQDKNQIQKGTSYGTLIHRVMANIDFSKVSSISDIKKSLQNLVFVGKLKEEEAGFINPNKIKLFFETEIGKKFIEADKNGDFYREKPFMIEKAAWDLMRKDSSLGDKKVLIQGIIDAYAIMNDGIYLLDYKTDKLENGQEKMLIDRYKVQIDIYKEALEKTLGIKVKKAVLYSFSLNKEIEC